MITGKVMRTELTYAVVDVEGIGYLVFVPSTSYCEVGSIVTLHTYLAVRETALDLYGFNTPEELQMFELLITLPKVGPKSAMQIMAQADLATLNKAIQQEDASYLSKMSGIGKKSAEKIVAGLKDKVEALGLNEVDVEVAGGTAADSDNASDIIDALITLGYPQKDARDAVQKITTDDPTVLSDTNQAIKSALKILGG